MASSRGRLVINISISAWDPWLICCLICPVALPLRICKVRAREWKLSNYKLSELKSSLCTLKCNSFTCSTQGLNMLWIWALICMQQAPTAFPSTISHFSMSLLAQQSFHCIPFGYSTLPVYGWMEGAKHFKGLQSVSCWLGPGTKTQNNLMYLFIDSCTRSSFTQSTTAHWGPTEGQVLCGY